MVLTTKPRPARGRNHSGQSAGHQRKAEPKDGWTGRVSPDPSGHHENIEELDGERKPGGPQAPQCLHFYATQSPFSFPRGVRRTRQQLELSRAWSQYHRSAVADVAEFRRSHVRRENDRGTTHDGGRIARRTG